MNVFRIKAGSGGVKSRGARTVAGDPFDYKSKSGLEGDWFLTGFSPRKQDLTLYIMNGVERYPALMRKLGKHKTGKSCLYIRRLSDIDLQVLEELIGQSVRGLSHL